jgi:hypothetical protein
LTASVNPVPDARLTMMVIFSGIQQKPVRSLQCSSYNQQSRALQSTPDSNRTGLSEAANPVARLWEMLIAMPCRSVYSIWYLVKSCGCHGIGGFGKAARPCRRLQHRGT